MKVTYDNDSPKRKGKSKKRKRRGGAGMIYAYLLIVVCGVLVTLSLTVWFQVKSVTVSGGSIYGNDEVLLSSGIYIGDSLLRLSPDEVSAKIEKSLPYVKKADVSRKLSGTVKIKITDAEENTALKSDGKYYVVDKDFKLLRITEEKPDGLPVISGAVIGNTDVGDTVKLGDRQQREALDKILLLENDGINVTYLKIMTNAEVSDYYTYAICIDDRLYAELGDANNLDRKLTHLETMMSSITESGTARISLADWSVTNKRAVLKYEDISSYIDE